MNLIHGRHVFRVAGYNMVLSDEGATAFLQNALGTTFPLVIDRVATHQLFEAHTAELLEPGDYKLVVKSRAGDAAGPLQTSFRKVKYMRVEDPPVPIEFDFAQTEGVNEGQVNETADTLLHVSEGCEIPAWGEGDSITLTGRGQTWTMPTPVVDTESMTYGFQIPQDVGGTLEEDDPCEFTIRSGGRTGTLAAVWRH